MDKSTFVYVAYIRTSPQKLWAALTQAKSIEKYWFGMRIETTWKVGSVWKFYSNDKLMDSGKILERVPQKRLVRTWVNEWSPKLKAEGQSRCIFELERTGASTKLTVTHSIGHTRSKFIGAVSEGWPMIISNLKSLLETGEIALKEHTGHGD